MPETVRLVVLAVPKKPAPETESAVEDAYANCDVEEGGAGERGGGLRDDAAAECLESIPVQSQRCFWNGGGGGDPVVGRCRRKRRVLILREEVAGGGG